MNSADFLGPQPTVVDLKAKNRWDAIDELIAALAANHKLKPEDAGPVAVAVKRRETAMSTGIGYGIAIPHASTDLVEDVVGAVGRSAAGVEFESLDGIPVNLVFLYVVPKGKFVQHLHTLANLARLVQQPEFRDGLWRQFG